MLEIKGVTKVYNGVRVVDNVSLSVRKGEIFGLVGESGSGKSTLGKMILGLIQPTSGEICFDLEGPLRREAQIVFQNPYNSLNPRMTAEKIVREPLDVHRLDTGNIDALFELVGLDPSYKNRYPHEFSGGQRQRIAIARALAVNPSFVLLDEPTSALDVSVQAQIVNMLKELHQERDLTYIVIGHDLTMMEHLCDRIGVMKEGKLLEVAETTELFRKPTHAYTRTLIESIPKRKPNNRLTPERLRL